MAFQSFEFLVDTFLFVIGLCVAFFVSRLYECMSADQLGVFDRLESIRVDLLDVFDTRLAGHVVLPFSCFLYDCMAIV